MPENCAAIVIAAKHHELIKVKDVRGTTNTVGALRCKFQFRTEDWLHSAKTAMFCNGDAVLHPEVINDAISVPLDADDECPVPYEVLTDTLPYSIGVWGVTNSGFRVVSNWLVFNAQVGCYTEGNAPEDPEQTVYDEILLISNDAVNAANEVTQRANNGEFDGKSAYEVACDEGFVGSQTEWLASLVGEKGDDGYTPVRGTDYWTESDKTEINEHIDEAVETAKAYTDEKTKYFELEGSRNFTLNINGPKSPDASGIRLNADWIRVVGVDGVFINSNDSLQITTGQGITVDTGIGNFTVNGSEVVTNATIGSIVDTAVDKAIADIEIPDGNIPDDITVDSIVIGEGEVTDKGIAGGTTDKSFAANIVGNTLANLVPLTKSKAEGDFSIAIGANNEALSAGGIALGYDNIAGAKGNYLYHIVDKNTRCVRIGQWETCPTLMSQTNGDSGVTGRLTFWQNNYAIGDKLLIYIGDKVYEVEVEDFIYPSNDGQGEVMLKTLPFSSTDLALNLTGNPMHKMVVHVNNPMNGAKPLGWGGAAIGAINRAHGNSALAYGYKNTISGDFGTAVGQENKAGEMGFAGGIKSEATGKGSIAFGNECKATKDYAVALGGDCEANGIRSFAAGNNSKATKDYAVALGDGNTASGKKSFATGATTEATESASFSEGTDTHALHGNSHSAGIGTKTGRDNQFVVGQYNKVSSKALFVVGDGSSNTNRTNIFECNDDGTAWLNGKPIATQEWVKNKNYISSIPSEYITETELNTKTAGFEPEIDASGNVNRVDIKAGSNDEYGVVSVYKSGSRLAHVKDGKSLALTVGNEGVEIITISPSITPGAGPFMNIKKVATEDYVRNLIDESLGVIENGTY